MPITWSSRSPVEFGSWHCRYRTQRVCLFPGLASAIYQDCVVTSSLTMMSPCTLATACAVEAWCPLASFPGYTRNGLGTRLGAHRNQATHMIVQLFQCDHSSGSVNLLDSCIPESVFMWKFFRCLYIHMQVIHY